jgi:hypothetical protein
MADRSMSMPVSKPGMAGNIAGWILCIVLAFAFVMAGGMKLSGNRAMVQLFDQVGVGQWFRYFTCRARRCIFARLTHCGSHAPGICGMKYHLDDAGGSALIVRNAQPPSVF